MPEKNSIFSDQQKPSVTIVLADDDADDCAMMLDLFREAKIINTVYTVEDGQALLDFLQQIQSDAGEIESPPIVFLDLNMPRLSGLEALKRMKQDVALKAIPVIVLTTSFADQDILDSYHLEADAYIKKPANREALFSAFSAVKKLWVDLSIPVPNTSVTTALPDVASELAQTPQ
ncbi:MAG: response regulator [Cyanobacteria bacterium P01_H01_bin.74]